MIPGFEDGVKVTKARGRTPGGPGWHHLWMAGESDLEAGVLFFLKDAGFLQNFSMDVHG